MYPHVCVSVAVAVSKKKKQLWREVWIPSKNYLGKEKRMMPSSAITNLIHIYQGTYMCYVHHPSILFTKIMTGIRSVQRLSPPLSFSLSCVSLIADPQDRQEGEREVVSKQRQPSALNSFQNKIKIHFLLPGFMVVPQQGGEG